MSNAETLRPDKKPNVRTSGNVARHSGDVPDNSYSDSTLNSSDSEITRPHRFLALTVLYHPDHSRLGDVAPLDPVSPTNLSRYDTLFQSSVGGPLRPLADLFVSRQLWSLSPGIGGSVRLHCPSPRHHVSVKGRRLESDLLVDTEELARGVVITIAERIVLLLHRTAAEPHSAQSFGLVGESNTMRAVRAAIERAAASDVPVLLRGETGSGKELVAKAIAKSSQRRRPYVTVNMSAIIPDMAPAEFFGVHRKSATGVDAREGIFAEARGGTLFLDEIGLAHVQVLNTLLRALDSGEIQRVGSKPSERPQVNVRLISATDTNLERAISQGTFSQAVLQRLGSYQIMLPPLRERREDLGSLLVHFLRAELAKLGQQHRLDYDQASLGWLRASLVARIAEYPFPGNVRELRNLAQALAVHSSALSEARLPEDWTQKLSSQDYCENTSKTHPPSVNLSTHEEPPLQPPPSARQHQDTSDEEFRQIARNCKYSKSSMASLLHWDRRLVDKRCKALGMRSVKEITKSEFAAAVRRLGWDWDRLADHFEISKKSLQDAFGAPTPNGYRLLPDE